MNRCFRYEDRIWLPTDAKEIIFGKIFNRAKVLDLGCWTGRFGEKLKKEKNCYVVGVDIDKQAVKIARKRLNKVILLDLDNPEKLLKQTNEKFDVIVMADVLEHLKKPSDVLLVNKKLLKDNGYLIASIPNIAYIGIRLKFLFGKFEYQKTGILDETHLRFFTLKTSEELFKSAGYLIKEFEYTGRRFLPSLNAFQFVYVCQKPPSKTK